jgi:hypothetical protein
MGTLRKPRELWKFLIKLCAGACSARIESERIPVGRLRSDSIGIDSLWGGRTMPEAYSADMRTRVIARVESGASRREAEHYNVSASTESG